MKFWSFTEKILAENKYLKAAVLVLALAVVAEALVINALHNKQKVVVIPAALRGEFWVTGDTVSRSYVEQVALYVADRILSVSPENIDDSFERASVFFTTDPEGLKKIKENLAEIKNVIVGNSYYQTFYPGRVDLTGQDMDNIVIEGRLRRLVGEQFIEDVNATVKMTYVVKNGRLYITSFVVE